VYKELNLENICVINNSKIYTFDNNTYIITNPMSRQLLSSPEIIGVEIPHFLESPIADFLQYYLQKSQAENINIVNILRGGLNFPIEDACHSIAYPVSSVSFLTSERVFIDKKVSRIESKYRKIISIGESTIIIGDIIASGETLTNTVHYLMEQYIIDSEFIRRILVFTIGTVKTLEAIKRLNRELMQRWPSFEGIITIFIEGIFSTYSDEGMTKLNLPHVDFMIRNGIITPEYRKVLIESKSLIFEKCAIYDGGARRFEQLDHIKCITTYWEELHRLATHIDTHLFLVEKFGYAKDITYKKWLQLNNYNCTENTSLIDLFNKEILYFEYVISCGLQKIANERTAYLKNYYSFYLPK